MTTRFTALRLMAPALALALVPSGELKLKESDHKTLSKLMGDYFTALREEKGISETLKKVLDQIEAKDERLKGTKILSSVGDWEEVFRMVSEGRVSNTLKKRGEVTATQLMGPGDVPVNLAYCTPKKPTKTAIPLILAVCDKGETPVDHLNNHWSDPALREGAYLAAVDLGTETASWGLFGSPEAPAGAWVVMTSLGLLQGQFAYDVNHVFLVGSGKGYSAALMTASSFPQLFAGLVGIGAVEAPDTSLLDNLRSLPTLFLKSGEAAKPLESKLEELGFGNSKSLPEGGAAEAWAWMGATKRESYPTWLSFTPRSEYSKGPHWVNMVGFQSSEQPHIDCKADRSTNTITIDAAKVAQLVVYLNDELVDLDKPVRLVVNGTSQELALERNARLMIKNQYDLGDWGRIFTAYVSLDVPPK